MENLSDILTSKEAYLSYASLGIGVLNALYDRITNNRHNNMEARILMMCLEAGVGGYTTGVSTATKPGNVWYTLEGVGLSVGSYTAGYYGTQALMDKFSRRKKVAEDFAL